MPNTIAYFALILWPVVTLMLFAWMRPARALIWSLLGGYLLLPVNTAFDFPGVPALDKTTIPNISALIGALIFAKGPVVRLPREWWVLTLMAIYIASPVFTVLTNPDPLFFGSLVLPGLRPYDALSAGAYKVIDLLPLVLGYNLLRGTHTQSYFLQALLVAALGYSVLMLIEIRLSPQLHTWIYGFFPHSFAQQARDGGYRPVVFLGHGLLVAIFTSIAVVAAAYFARRRTPVLGFSAWLWLGYLICVLLLCRSLGAVMLALAALGMMFFMRYDGIRLACASLALTVLAYPMLRGADVVPVQLLADQIATVSEARAASLQIRIDNEDSLLARANERPWLGWGGYGRNRVFDQATGNDLSITDGTWIIIVGSHGWVGYIASFGLLSLPVLIIWRRRVHLNTSSAALSLALTVNILDLIPNSSLTQLTWLIAGSLMALPRQSVIGPGRPKVTIATEARFKTKEVPDTSKV